MSGSTPSFACRSFEEWWLFVRYAYIRPGRLNTTIILFFLQMQRRLLRSATYHVTCQSHSICRSKEVFFYSRQRVDRFRPISPYGTWSELLCYTGLRRRVWSMVLIYKSQFPHCIYVFLTCADGNSPLSYSCSYFFSPSVSHERDRHSHTKTLLVRMSLEVKTVHCHAHLGSERHPREHGPK